MARPRKRNPKYDKNNKDFKNSKTTDESTSTSEEASTDNSKSNKATNKPASNNDPEWYSRDNQLVIDAASLPYSEPLGDAPQMKSAFGLGNVSGNSNFTFSSTGEKASPFSGLMSVKTKASFGFNDDMKSPLNIAAQMLYSHVRVKNSGRKNYDSPDLMMYVASMADIYSFIVWCMRIYAKAFLYSQRNKYIGDAFMLAEHLNPSDFKQNLANFRYWLNSYINKIAAFAVPKDLAYFNRRVWMYSGIYLENPDANIKDQLYEFSPDGFYRFDLDDNKAGRLSYYTISDILGHGNPLQYSDIITIGNWLLTNVTGDEDFALMSGDIIKAFDGNIIMLSSIAEDPLLVPTYDEYVLEQFHNMRVYGGVLRGNNAIQITKYSDTDTKHRSGDVFQLASKGILCSYEMITHDDMAADYDVDVPSDFDALTMQVLDVNTPVPNPIDNMEISRLTVTGRTLLRPSDNVGDPYYVGLTCGADIAVGIDVVYFDHTLNNVVSAVHFGSTALYASNSSYARNFKDLIRLRIFKYGPMMKMYVVEPNEIISGVMVEGNINNYTIVDSNTIAKMHEVAMLSLLSVPGVAKLINHPGISE